jgi:ABC-2 type transport system permease protein
MNGALLYLTFCTFKNRMRVRLRRLRNPRYAAGLVVGVAYLYLAFFRRRARVVGAAGAMALLHRFQQPLELFAALALLLFVALVWVWPTRSRPALAFTRADVQLLFPAPLTRRQLVRYKILSSQVGAFIGSALLTVFFRPTTVSGGWIFFLGISLIIAVLNLHLTGISLSRESLAVHGRAGIARQWLPVTLVTGAVLVLAATLVSDWRVLSSLPAEGVVRELMRLGRSGAAGVVLWPFRALVALPLAPSGGAFLRALPAVVAILVLNYLWVMRCDAAFEEASAELAEKIARRRRGSGAGLPRAGKGVSAPFPLSLEGRPEGAVLWKNLILLGRYVSIRTLLRVVLVLGVFSMFVLARGRAGGSLLSVIVPGCLALAAGTILFGPQMLRNDLRQDLSQLGVLKTWPVRGAALVRGEVLAPATVLSVAVWLMIAGAALFSSRASFLKDVPAPTRLSYAFASALLAPGLILVQLLAHNALALMFPAWVAVGRSRARGVDVMGQRMLLMAGMLVALALAALPAALAAGVVGYLLYSITGIMMVFPAAAVASVVLLAEGAIATEVLGTLLERTDVTAVEAEE